MPRSSGVPGALASLTPPTGFPGVAPERFAMAATRWAALAPTAQPQLAGRLEVLLRRIVAVVLAERPPVGAAEAIGADLHASGITVGAQDPVRLLPMSLALVRAESPQLFDVVGRATTGAPTSGSVTDGLVTVLDGIAAGFARAHAGDDRPSGPAPDRGSCPVEPWRYEAAIDQAVFAVGAVSLDGAALVGNPALVELLGMVGPSRPLTDFVHADDRAEVVRMHQRLVTGDVDVVRVDVRLVPGARDVAWVHVVGALIRRPDGTPTHVQVLIEDVTRPQDRSALRVPTAGRGAIEHLPGVAQLEAWLHQAVHDGTRTVGVCSIGLDGFAAHLDLLGADGADRLLLAVAGRLQLVAGGSRLARADAAGFLVFTTGSGGSGDPVRVADRLVDALAVPFLIGGRAVEVTASIGVAHAETAGSTAAELIRRADVAQRWARSFGGGRRVEFDHRQDTAEAGRFALLSGLRAAVGRSQLRVEYQPLVDLDSRRLRGAEALVRWEHPEDGLIGPGRFIETAERDDSIVPLGHWVLSQACAEAARWWRELGVEAPYVSVNVSPVQLADPGWADDVAAALGATGLPAAQLQLEITEHAVLVDEATAMNSMSALAAAGVRFALDDFGTGYSSFTWLRNLPVHMLKIDGSFVDGLRHAAPDRTDRLIVRALVDMAHALDLDVTAEWVETPVQARRLAELGCDVGQGRWFGDPGPGRWVPAEFRRRLAP